MTLERYRLALRAAQVGLFDWDLRTNQVFYSPEWKRQIGFDDDEITNSFAEWESRLHPDDLSHVLRTVRAFVAKPWPDYQVEFRFRHKDGSYRWVLTQASMQVDAGGQPVRMLGLHVDITERKCAELSLRKSEEAYRTLVETSHDLIWSVDAEGRWTFVNPAARAIYGYDPAEMLGRPFMDFQSPEQARKDLEVFALIKAGAPRFKYETVHIRKDGTPVWLTFNAVVLRDEQGKVLGTTGTAQDTTERRLAEEALRARERELRLITNHLPGPISHVSRDLRYLFVNDHYERIFGKARAEVLGRTMAEVIGAELFQRVEPQVRRVLAGEQVSFESQVRTAAGVLDHALVTFVPDLDPEGNAVGFFVIAFDISARKHLEEQLRQAQKMEAVGQLAGGVAHDFNNVLTVIQGHTAMLELDSDLPAITRESLGEIKQAADRAANLTRQLLTFSRRQARRPSHLNFNAVVTNMARLLGRVLGEDVALDLHLSNQDLVVLADAGMMEQVLLNLAVNSRDAMPRGGRLGIETSSADFDATIITRMPQARAGVFVCLAISDTGTGIPVDVLPRIFEPFFTTKEVGKGTGLGLATVYGIVQQHEGWITVESDPGRGTTFRVYLPWQIGAKVEPPTRRETEATRGGHETILLVEDEPALRGLVGNLLERAGYRVFSAANGPQALAQWRAHPKEVDLLLTDLVMPDGMSGFDLGALLTHDDPRLRVVYTSGYSPEIAGRGQELIPGVNFLAKPFVADGLLEIVRAALDRA